MREPAPTPRRSPRPPALTRGALGEAAFVLGLIATAGAAFWVLVLLPAQLRTRDLERRRDALAREVDDLRRSIDDVRRETAALESDPWAVEQALRRRLGFLRPDERVLRDET